VTRPGEDDLIATYFRPLATTSGAARLEDDAATLAVPAGHELVVTKDMLAAGIHFFAEDPWDAVARKALRVNLSDLAAKGATPHSYALGLGLPPDWQERDLALLSKGLRADQTAFGFDLLGGDTIKSPGGLMLSVTAFGLVPTGRAVRRGGGKPGDIIYVSGTIGDSALGLQLRLDSTLADAMGLTDAERAHLLDRYLIPEPRVALAGAVRDHAHAAMDVSDGLVGDLSRLARASRLGAILDASAVPLSPAARVMAREPRFLETALTGGDDYEILATVPIANTDAFEQACEGAGVAVTRIGRLVGDSREVAVVGGDGAPIAFKGRNFAHF
jgi:thiamine-monophosphate kinase